MDPAKMQAIIALQPLKNLKKMWEFIDSTIYHQRFVNNFANTSQLLTNLTKSNIKYILTIECQQAFEVLKRKLIISLILIM